MSFIDFSFKLFEYFPERYSLWRYRNALLGLGFSHLKVALSLLGFFQLNAASHSHSSFETFVLSDLHFSFNRRFFIDLPLRVPLSVPDYGEFHDDFLHFLHPGSSEKFSYAPVIPVSKAPGFYNSIPLKKIISCCFKRRKRFVINNKVITHSLLTNAFSYFLFFDLFSFFHYREKLLYSKDLAKRPGLRKEKVSVINSYSFWLFSRGSVIPVNSSSFYSYTPVRSFCTIVKTPPLSAEELSRRYEPPVVNRILEQRSLREQQRRESQEYYFQSRRRLAESRKVDARTAWIRACARALRYVKEKAALRAAKKAHLQYKRDRVEFDFLSLVADPDRCREMDQKFRSLSKKDHFKLAYDVFLESGSLVEGPFFDTNDSNHQLGMLGDLKTPKSFSRENDYILTVHKKNPGAALMSDEERSRILAEIQPSKLLAENPEYAAIMSNRKAEGYYENREHRMITQEFTVLKEHKQRELRIENDPIGERCPYGVFRVKRPYYKRFEYVRDRIFLDDLPSENITFEGRSHPKPKSVLVEHRHLMNVYVNSLINQTPEAMDRIRSKFFWNHVLDKALGEGYIYPRDGLGIRKPDYRKLSKLRAIAPLNPLDRLKCLNPDYIPSPIDLDRTLLVPKTYTYVPKSQMSFEPLEKLERDPSFEPSNYYLRTFPSKAYIDNLSGEQRLLYENPEPFVWDNPEKKVAFFETEVWDPVRDLAWPKKPVKKRYWPRIRKGYIPPLLNNSSMRIIEFNINKFLYYSRAATGTELDRWASLEAYVQKNLRLICGFSLDETFNIARTKELEFGTSPETYETLCFLENEVNTYVVDSKLRKLKRQAKLTGVPLELPAPAPVITQDEIDSFIFDHDPVSDFTFFINLLLLLQRFFSRGAPTKVISAKVTNLEVLQKNLKNIVQSFWLRFIDFICLITYCVHEDIIDLWARLDNIYSAVYTPELFQFEDFHLYSDVFGFFRWFLLPSTNKVALKKRLSLKCWSFKHPRNVIWRLNKKDFARRGILNERGLAHYLAFLHKVDSSFSPFCDVAFKYDGRFSIFPHTTAFFNYFDMCGFFEWLVQDPSVLNLSACLAEFKSWGLDYLSVSVGVSMDLGRFYEWGTFFSVVNDICGYIQFLRRNFSDFIPKTPAREGDITILRPELFNADKVLFHFQLSRIVYDQFSPAEILKLLSDIEANLLEFVKVVRPYLLLLSWTNLDAPSQEDLMEARFFMLHGYQTTDFFSEYWLFQLKEGFFAHIFGRLDELSHACRFSKLPKESSFFALLLKGFRYSRNQDIRNFKSQFSHLNTFVNIADTIPDDIVPLTHNLPLLPDYLKTASSDFRQRCDAAFKEFT